MVRLFNLLFSKEVRPIIETIKKIIKNKKKDSPIKLLALKLLNDCLTQAVNEDFLSYTDQKIMSRLGKMARFKKELNDIERGATLFGQNYNQKASADFLKLLLLFIQKWATTLRSSTGKQTESLKLYNALIKERVQIPSEEAVYNTLSFDNDPVLSKKTPQSNNGSRKPSNNNIEFNKTQFQSYQGLPLGNQSTNNLMKQNLKNNQPNDDSNMSVKRDSSRQNQSISERKQPQNSDRHDDSTLTKEKQLLFQKQIKEDYKKLSEYHQSSKFAEDILAQGGDQGSGLDDQLLLDFRTQLTEGKQFSEHFLKRLMESPIPIKDSETKINKILLIIGEISTTLEKLLIFKPYSPRSLREMENKIKKEEAITINSANSNVKQIQAQAQVKKDIAPQDSERVSMNKNKGRYGLDVSKSQQVFKKNKDGEDALEFNQARQKFDDVNINQDIFKTNFAFAASDLNQDKNHNTDVWGTNSASAFSQNGFGDFNSFNPIQSAFDFQPQTQQKKNQQEILPQKSLDMIQVKQPVQQKPLEVKQVEKIEEQKSVVSVQEELIKQEEIKTQKIIKKNQEKLKTSSKYSNIQMPSHQKPMLFQQVQVQPIDMDEQIKESQNNLSIVQPLSEEKNKVDKSKGDANKSISSPDSKVIREGFRQNVKFGVVMKPQNQLPHISESPDADLSEEEDLGQLRNSINEKDSFKFPSPSQNQKILRQTQNQDNDFSWDFNGKNTLPKTTATVDAFGFNVQPLNKTSDKKEEQKKSQVQIATTNPFSFDGFQSQAPRRETPKSVKGFESFDNFKSPFSVDNTVTDQHQKEELNAASERFDFNMIANIEEQEIDSDIVQLNLQISNQRSKIDDLRLQNDNLKLDLKNAICKYKDSERQYKENEIRVPELIQEIKQLEKEKLETRVQLEDTENELKYYKKFEFLYEQEQFSKTELSNQIAELTHKTDEYRKMADRQEHQVIKKDKEIELLKSECEKLQQQTQDVKEQAERDQENQRLSEGENKKQLQKELFQSKQKEEQAIVQHQIDIQEFQKREDAIHKKHQIELKDISEREYSLNYKLLEDQKSSLARENILKEMIQQLQSQLEDQKAQSKETTPQQKLVFRSSQIKFNKGSSEELKRYTAEDSKSQRSPSHFDNGFSNEIKNSNSSHRLMDSGIKILNQSPAVLSSYIAEQTPIHSVQEQQFNQRKANQFDTEMKEKEQLSIRELSSDHDSLFEDTMPPVPSSDSDKEEYKYNAKEIKKDSQPIIVEEYQELDEIYHDSIDHEVKDEFEFLQVDKQSPKIEMIKQSQTQQKQVDGFDFSFPDQDEKKSNDALILESCHITPPKSDKIVHNEDAQSFWGFEDNKSLIKDKSIEIKIESQSIIEKDVNMSMSISGQKDLDMLNDLNPQQQIHQSPVIIRQSSIDQPIAKTEHIKSVQNDNITQIKKKDSFLDMFGDLLSGNNKNDQPQTQSQNQPNLSPLKEELNLDELLAHKNGDKIYSNRQSQSYDELMKEQITPQKVESKNSNNGTNQFSPDINDDKNKIINMNQSQISPQIQSSESFKQNIPSSNQIIPNQNPINHQFPSQLSPVQNNQHFQQIQHNSGQSPIIPPLQLQNLNQELPKQIYSTYQQPAQIIPQQHIIQSTQQFQTQIQIQQPKSVVQNQQNMNQIQSNRTPEKDISLDKSQFSTMNTEQYAQDQKQLQLKLDPSSMLKVNLLTFFRKSLASNKAILYEDQNIQIGMLSEYQPQGLVRMRVFMGNKTQNQVLSQIKFNTAMQPIGYHAQQNRDQIPSIPSGQQEPIDIVIKISTYQLSIPLYSLNYQLNNVQMANLPIRLPIVLLKFCNAIPQLDTQGFIYKWNFECGEQTEAKQSFNVDFNQCRSLSQLKEVLQFGKNAFTFVDGVEQQKNIVCGGTVFSQLSPHLQVFALIKITITGNGQNCQIVGRSSDNEGANEAKGKFVKFVISNILEMIALQVNH